MTSSEQARADALADAETLRQIAAEYDPAPLDQVDTFGGPDLSTPEAAARAAFRAVPGLRGE